MYQRAVVLCLVLDLLGNGKMKRTVQTTLTGESFKKKPIRDPKLAANQTSDCRFVEELCALRDARRRAETLREAQIEWKSIKGDRELVDSRIRAYEETVDARQRVTCQFFKPTGDTLPSVRPQAPHQLLKLQAAVRCDRPLPWLAHHRSQRSLSQQACLLKLRGQSPPFLGPLVSSQESC